MKIAVSACLLGDKVRYDGQSKLNKELSSLLSNHKVIKICPELMAGFEVPHEPLEILNDKVYTKSNIDVTDKLRYGAKLCLNKVLDCDLVILKSKSPSCGHIKIYDGSFTGTLIEGEGVFTKLCLENNIPIYTEENIDILKTFL